MTIAEWISEAHARGDYIVQEIRLAMESLIHSIKDRN